MGRALIENHIRKGIIAPFGLLKLTASRFHPEAENELNQITTQPYDVL